MFGINMLISLRSPQSTGVVVKNHYDCAVLFGVRCVCSSLRVCFFVWGSVCLFQSKGLFLCLGFLAVSVSGDGLKGFYGRFPPKWHRTVPLIF